MTASLSSFLQIPEDKIQESVNSCALSSLMITTAGMADLVSRNLMERVDPLLSIGIAAVPFIISPIIQRWVPQTNDLAIRIGAIAGMGIPLFIGPTAIGFATASLVGGLTTGAIALF